MKILISLALTIVVLAFTACSEKEDPTAKADWNPSDASVARHITTVHGFTINEEEGSHLKVERIEGQIVATFRDDVLEELGGEKALFILGWEENPQAVSRPEYLYFLEALHAYLVLNAPKWDGGENPSAKITSAKADS